MEPHERADPDARTRRAERAELAELRRRAYGPGSDADPADLARLRVLEARTADAPVVTRTDAAASAPGRGVGAGVADADARRAAAHAAHDAPADTNTAGGSADDDAPSARSRPRAALRLAILWAASVAAAVAVTAVIVATVTAPVGREVAVVRFDPDQELPVYMRDYFGGAETGSARFHGLTLVRLENDRSAYPQVRAECLSVQPSRAALGSTEGGGCAAGAFGASAQFVVGIGAPEELRDEYPVGTALLFDLRGDAVHVRVDDSGRVPSPTRTPR
ncbi:hypothetical protein [Clavibacter sp. CFBP 8614]|uniref:hypothetical protein n=1 Tax=unclassified Clavibacter TaxID=2626594 RepID=UPI004041EC7A